MQNLDAKVESLVRDLPDEKAARLFLERVATEQPRTFQKLLRDPALLSDTLALAAWSPLLATTLEQNPEYVSWLKRERWDALTEEEQEGFAPLCPDFVIELRSRSDDLPPLEDKMLEYIANGAQMAWLIDPLRKRVYIYRPNQKAEILEDPETVSGDPELPGSSWTCVSCGSHLNHSAVDSMCMGCFNRLDKTW